LISGYFKNIICWAATGLTDLGFLRIIQKFKIVGRETNNNKGFLRIIQKFKIVGRETNNNKGHFI